MSTEQNLVATVAEKAVIGALLRYSSETTASFILASTDVDDFEIPACRAIRDAAGTDTSAAFDLTTVAMRLEQAGLFGDIINIEMLRTLVAEAPLPITVEEHVQALKAMRAARSVALQSQALNASILSSHGDPEKIAESVEVHVSCINDAMVNVGSEHWTSLGNSAEALLNKDRSGPSELIPTGLAGLDEIFNGGAGRGTITTIAARPGFGKSALALDIFKHMTLVEGAPSIFFSLEMGQEEVTARLLGSAARVGHTAIRHGNITPDEERILAGYAQEMAKAPAYIDTRDTVSPQDVTTTFARLNAIAKREHGRGIEAVFFDYLQLQTSPNRFASRQEEISTYMRAWKRFAMRENVAVFLVAQLNRGEKNRDVEHRPTVKDLRESGSIEQDSDRILLLAKPESDEIETPRGEMNLIIGKNRNGPTADIPLTFMAHYPRFEMREESEDPVEAW